MRFDETRENTTAKETQTIKAEAEFLRNSRHIRLVEERDDAPAKILPVIVTVDELPPIPRVPFNPSHQVVEYAKGDNGWSDREVAERNDAAKNTTLLDESDDEPEDDGQPSEYDEWQDYMGGDEYYDHSENACW